MTATDEQVRAWASVLRVHAAVVPRLERELAAVGMPLSWYDVLLELNAAPDRRLRMTELGARAVLSRERVSRVVDELERAGLVRRERNPDDGRSLLAVITDEGRARLRAAAPTYLAGIERHFGAHLDAGRGAGGGDRAVPGRRGRRATGLPHRPHRPHADADGRESAHLPPRVGTFAGASRHLRQRKGRAARSASRGRAGDGPPTTRHTEPVQHAVGRG